MATMGEMLRAARDQSGLSLEAVSSATRIPRHNLIALEADNLEVLPAEPFTRGLIRVYTRALAVPEEPVLNAYATALSARRLAAGAPDRALRRSPGALDSRGHCRDGRNRRWQRCSSSGPADCPYRRLPGRRRPPRRRPASGCGQAACWNW